MQSVDPLELLANAIIEQAIRDYRRLWNVESTREKREIREFFLSGWFSVLSKADPLYILNKLEEEERGKREKAKREAEALSSRW